MSLKYQAPDPYYTLARMMQRMSRQDLALALKQFHQSSVDNSMDAACEIVRSRIENSELADSIVCDIRKTYVAGGHIADDRKYLARTEALLYTLLKDRLGTSSTTVDRALADSAYAAGHGIDTSTDGGNIELTIHPAKFAGV